MQETQHLLDKIRPPRVQITYDVEIGDAIEMKELPFVVGVMADLSGDRDPNNPLDPVKARRFTEVDVDSFDSIMEKANPVLYFQVDNLIANNNTQMNLALKFNTIDDFSPVNIISQVPAMNALYQTRTALSNLLIKLDGNDNLEALLTNLLTDKSGQTQLTQALGLAAPAAGSDASSEDAKPNNKPKA